MSVQDDEYGNISSEHLFTKQEIKKQFFASQDLKQRHRHGIIVSQNSYRRFQSLTIYAHWYRLTVSLRASRQALRLTPYSFPITLHSGGRGRGGCMSWDGGIIFRACILGRTQMVRCAEPFHIPVMVSKKIFWLDVMNNLQKSKEGCEAREMGSFETVEIWMT